MNNPENQPASIEDIEKNATRDPKVEIAPPPPPAESPSSANEQKSSKEILQEMEALKAERFHATEDEESDFNKKMGKLRGGLVKAKERERNESVLDEKTAEGETGILSADETGVILKGKKLGEAEVEKQKWLFEEAKERKEEQERPESEFKKVGRQLKEFKKLWEENVRKTAFRKMDNFEQSEFAKLAHLAEELALTKEMVQKAEDIDLIGQAKEEVREKYKKQLEKAGLDNDNGVYNTREFRLLLADKTTDIYTKKAELFNIARKIIETEKNNRKKGKTGQLESIINQVKDEIKENGEYRHGDTVIKKGEKINGRVILESGKVYFEIAGRRFEAWKAKKLKTEPEPDVLNRPDPDADVSVLQANINNPPKTVNVSENLPAATKASDLPDLASSAEQPEDKLYEEQKSQLDDTTIEADPLRGERIEPPAEVLPPKSAEPELPLPGDIAPESQKQIKKEAEKILGGSEEEGFILTPLEENLEKNDEDNKYDDNFKLMRDEDFDWSGEPISLEGPAVGDSLPPAPVPEKKKKSWWQFWK